MGGGSTAHFSINKLRKSKYVIPMQNSDGTAQSRAGLIITEFLDLPIITAKNAIPLDPYSARFSASVNPELHDTTVYFKYGLTSSSLDMSASTAGTPIGSGLGDISFTIVQFGLTPKTTYYYYVSASSAAGSVTSSTGAFRTFPTQTEVYSYDYASRVKWFAPGYYLDNNTANFRSYFGYPPAFTGSDVPVRR